MRKDKLLTLKKSIDKKTFDQFITLEKEWNDSYVIITSSPDLIMNHKNNLSNHKFACTLVITKNSAILSNFLNYVSKNIMINKDFYLFKLIAILSNDYIKQYGDMDDYYPLLNHLINRIYYYCKFYEYEWADANSIFKFIRLLASENISDEEINQALKYVN